MTISFSFQLSNWLCILAQSSSFTCPHFCIEYAKLETSFGVRKTYDKPFHEAQLVVVKLVTYFKLLQLLNSPCSCYASFLRYDEWPKGGDARKHVIH